MSFILEQLVEADTRAQAIVAEAEEFLETTVANMDREVEAYRESYAQRAEHRIGVVRDQEGEVSRRATKDISSHYAQLMDNLQKTYDDRHREWERELFEKCIC